MFEMPGKEEMIESLIISLREGIEIALVIGILVVYLQKIARPEIIKSVYVGLACAIFASIGGAILIQRLAIDQESIEGIFQLVAAGFVIFMVVWMWTTAKKIKLEIETKVNAIINSSFAWKAHLGILLFTFFMIVREGIETAIFLQAIALSTGQWESMLGTLLGLGMATTFAVMFIRGSVRIDIGRFLKVTAATLILFAFQLIVNAVHEFYEYGIFPASPRMMGIVGPLAQHETLFIIAIISIPAFMMMIPGTAPRETQGQPSRRGWQISAGIASIGIILFLGVGELFSKNSDKDLSAEFLSIPGSGLFEIPISKINDSRLHRYAFTDEGLEIRFFVLRTGMGTYATAFDACYACYSYGRYYLKNGELICSQCDAPSPLSKLHEARANDTVDENNSGSMEGNGCAPIYLPSRLDHGMVTINLSDLRHQRKYFDITQ